MRLKNRMLLLAIVGLILCGSARGESALCVVTENLAVLLDYDGGELIGEGLYDVFFALIDGERYAAGVQTEEGMRYALCDAQGTRLTDAVYDMLYIDNGEIIFRQEGRYGALDMSGKEVVNAEYWQLVSNGAGAYLALQDDPHDDYQDEVYYVVPGEEAVATGIYTVGGLNRVRDGRMPYLSSKTERYGYLDANGRQAMEPLLTYASEYKNGLACASDDGKLGVLDANGAWIVKPEYDFLEIGENVILALRRQSECVVLDAKNCEELFCIQGSNMEAGLVNGYPAILKNGQLSVYRYDGSVIMETDADVSISEGVGGQLILSEGDWGAQCVSILNEDGTRVDRLDQQLLPLQENRYAFLKMTVAAYYSDALGEIRYSCDYDSMRYGMIDASGNEILSAQYSEIRCLAENRFLLIAEDGLRVVDEDANLLWQRLEEESVQ